MGAFDFGPYKFVKGARMGELPKKTPPTFDELRLNYGIASIQRRLSLQGFDTHRTDGVFGFYSGSAAKEFQRDRDLKPVDGSIGGTECRELWTNYVFKRAAYFDIPPEYLWGLIFQESGFDPCAVGSVNPNDHGLMQINMETHQDVAEEQAFNAEFAIQWGGERMHEAYQSFKLNEDGTDCAWAWDCTIAQHNSPADARVWYETGVAPDEQIAHYVENVKTHYQKYGRPSYSDATDIDPESHGHLGRY